MRHTTCDMYHIDQLTNETIIITLFSHHHNPRRARVFCYFDLHYNHSSIYQSFTMLYVTKTLSPRHLPIILSYQCQFHHVTIFAPKSFRSSHHTFVYTYLYIYICLCLHIFCTHIYIYIYIYIYIFIFLPIFFD
jgi:hypothetical protein